MCPRLCSKMYNNRPANENPEPLKKTEDQQEQCLNMDQPGSYTELEIPSKLTIHKLFEFIYERNTRRGIDTNKIPKGNGVHLSPFEIQYWVRNRKVTIGITNWTGWLHGYMRASPSLIIEESEKVMRWIRGWADGEYQSYDIDEPPRRIDSWQTWSPY